jgi:hypothetical protein
VKPVTSLKTIGDTGVKDNAATLVIM